MDSKDNKALNVVCDFNGYLVCEMPKDKVEVELKIKTPWGKYTLNKTRYCRTEQYHPWDGKDGRAPISHRWRRTDRKFNNVDTIEIDTDTNLETDIPHRNSLGYAPEVFVNKEFAATVPSTDSEEIEIQHNFIGAYCEKCANAKFNWCWCNCSDWDDEVIVVDPPNRPTPTLTQNPEININITR